MAYRTYIHKKTKEVRQTTKRLPEQEWEEVLTPPNSKFMECANPATGKSKIKDLDKQLRTRARDHSRDVELDDNIQINSINGMDERIHANFLNEKGERRKRIDDL